MTVQGIRYQYFYSFNGEDWITVPKNFDSAKLSDEYLTAAYGVAFTGAFVGMMIVDGLVTKISTDFDYFCYREYRE